MFNGGLEIMVLFVAPQVGAQMSKLGKERNDFFSYHKYVGKKSAIVWSFASF